MVDEMLQEKLGEALGLEIAAQKAVKKLGSEGFLNEGGMLTQLQKMRTQAGNHQTKLEKTINNLTESKAQAKNIQQMTEETTEKCSKIMQTYLGNNPDPLEAIEFLCLAEGGEVIHYEVLSAMSKKIKNKKLSSTINSILREEKRHLELCTRLAKRIAFKRVRVLGGKAYGPGERTRRRKRCTRAVNLHTYQFAQRNRQRCDRRLRDNSKGNKRQFKRI